METNLFEGGVGVAIEEMQAVEETGGRSYEGEGEGEEQDEEEDELSLPTHDNLLLVGGGGIIPAPHHNTRGGRTPGAALSVGANERHMMMANQACQNHATAATSFIVDCDCLKNTKFSLIMIKFHIYGGSVELNS